MQKFFSYLRAAKNYLKAFVSFPFRMQKSVAQLSRELQRAQEQSEQNYRDLLQLAQGDVSIPKESNVKVVTDHPVAYDSQDHLQPFGTIRDNTRNFAFFAKCRSLDPKANLLDLGCSGGGLVFDFLINGHQAIGIEGSDRSQKSGRANWRTIPDHLFTADITKPFKVAEKSSKNKVVKFSFISCWEVLEHIPEADIPALLDNVTKHLKKDGVFVGSVSKMPDDPLHVSVYPNDWWRKTFEKHGFEIAFGYDDVFEFHEFCRGTGLSSFDTHNYQTHPEKGFHFVARVARKVAG